MLISVSGKIGSGKDLVGQIIQYYIDYRIHNLDLQTFLEHYELDGLDSISSIPIKKWADKLKVITTLILNCTREQLEDREFKETPLGENWRVWYGTNYKLKTNLNPNGRVTKLFLTEEEALRLKTTTELVRDVETEVLTPRKILQLLGTECGREILHPNIWVNALMEGYDKEKKIHDDWIITDTRFPNELQAVKDRGGITIHVTRPKGNHRSDLHASEVALEGEKFDYYFVNDGSIEDLAEKVKFMLGIEGII